MRRRSWFGVVFYNIFLDVAIIQSLLNRAIVFPSADRLVPNLVLHIPSPRT